MTVEAKSKSQGIFPNIVSGLATGLFSIPEGMAYAQLANANPIYGMYSGIVATIVSSLSMGIARLGSIANFVSTAVMTGLVAGASLLIILGQEHHLTGYSPVSANQMQKTVNWMQNLRPTSRTSLQSRPSQTSGPSPFMIHRPAPCSRTARSSPTSVIKPKASGRTTTGRSPPTAVPRYR